MEMQHSQHCYIIHYTPLESEFQEAYSCKLFKGTCIYSCVIEECFDVNQFSGEFVKGMAIEIVIYSHYYEMRK